MLTQACTAHTSQGNTPIPSPSSPTKHTHAGTHNHSLLWFYSLFWVLFSWFIWCASVALRKVKSRAVNLLWCLVQREEDTDRDGGERWMWHQARGQRREEWRREEWRSGGQFCPGCRSTPSCVGSWFSSAQQVGEDQRWGADVQPSQSFNINPFTWNPFPNRLYFPPSACLPPLSFSHILSLMVTFSFFLTRNYFDFSHPSFRWSLSPSSSLSVMNAHPEQQSSCFLCYFGFTCFWKSEHLYNLMSLVTVEGYKARVFQSFSRCSLSVQTKC